ncbi:hypothetical protein ASZ90_020095 [hydrocarbon metagenome]|uniref:Uncharacterized protein n=1 Tax=hydrocarbon metagenome TaxID=938273 RepID=A0A0W8E1A2_9ZZZZ
MKKDLFIILFWGSLWGLAEATLGFVLHLVAIALPGVPGFFMFPIAFYFMKKVYDSTGKAASVFYIAIVAASIKMVDFLLPLADPIRIVNPALSIILEGLVVGLVFHYCVSRRINLAYIHTLLMGIFWRSIFLVHLFVISLYDLPAALVTDGIEYTLRFLILESFVNSLLIYAYLRLEKDKPTLKVRPAYSLGVLILALGAQLML